jgi:hypothetical protein
VSITLDLADELTDPDLGDMVLIPDAETFKRIGVSPNNGGWYLEAKYFLLLDDLELTNWRGPEIYGAAYAAPQVKSFFDGGGHTVTIRSFDTAGGTLDCGLFTDVFLADFYNLNIVLDITGETEVVSLAGGLTALASGSTLGPLPITIEDVHVKGDLVVTSSSGVYDLLAGGIAGEISGGSISNCSSRVRIKAHHTVSGRNAFAGGLIGEIYNVEIFGAFFSGFVAGETAGGIVGQARSGGFNIIDYCYSVGNIFGDNSSGQAIAGGIAGIFDGVIDYSVKSFINSSYSAATVWCGGSSPSFAGGIAGKTGSANVEIKNCLALNETITGAGSSDTVRRVVADNTVNADLTDNWGWDGMTLTYDISNDPPSDQPPDPNPAGPDGEDLPISDPPAANDFSGMDSDIGGEWSTFTMPDHPDWNYKYPVLRWQIEEEIQPLW